MDQKSTEQQQARNFYFQSELTQQQIADLLNINRKTLYGWIKEGAWKRARYAAKHVPCILAEQYLGQLGELNAAIARRKDHPYPTKEEADIMRKVSMTYKTVKGNRKIISDNIELFSEFTQELRLDSFQTAKDFMPHMDKYIRMRIKEGHGLENPWKEYLKDKAEDQEYEEWLSLQPKPGPKSRQEIIDSFPPGYFTDDYDPDAPIVRNSGLNSDSEENEVLPPSPPVERAGVRSTRTELPNSQPGKYDLALLSNDFLLSTDSKENGVSNGVTPTAEDTPNPLMINISTENDNTDLSTKENEKGGVPGDTKRGIKITIGGKLTTIPTDELPDDIIKSLKALNEIVLSKQRERPLDNENNKAA